MPLQYPMKPFITREDNTLDKAIASADFSYLVSLYASIFYLVPFYDSKFSSSQKLS